MPITKKKQLNPDLSKGILFTIDKNNYKTWISKNIFKISNSATCFRTHLVYLTVNVFCNFVAEAINILYQSWGMSNISKYVMITDACFQPLTFFLFLLGEIVDSASPQHSTQSILAGIESQQE